MILLQKPVLAKKKVESILVFTPRGKQKPKGATCRMGVVGDSRRLVPIKINIKTLVPFEMRGKSGQKVVASTTSTVRTAYSRLAAR